MKKKDIIKLTFKMYKPEIETGLGLAWTICGMIDACKATLKAEKIVEETKVNISAVKQVREEYNESVYTPKTYKKDIGKIVLRTGKDLTKTYAFAGTVFTAGLGCMLMSNCDYKTTATERGLAYAAVMQGYREYRKRVIDKYGKEADDEIRFDISHKKVTETYEDENGKVKKRKWDVPVVGNPFLMNPYTYIWDGASSCEFNADDPFWNKNFLINMQNYFNELIRARSNPDTGKPGWVFLNEILNALGYNKLDFGMGQEVGFLYYPNGENQNGDNFIDFGLMEMYRDENGDLCFLNNESINLNESVWCLDFNAQGDILSILKNW